MIRTGQSVELLERSAQLGALAAHWDAVLRSGHGRLVVVGGEAGVGKTTLVRCYSESAAGRPEVHTGACDALFTARPLGPFVDIARSLGGRLAAVVSGEVRPDEVAATLLAELAPRRGAIVVLEDLHWADEATLDVVRLLARRLATSSVLVIATYRDDELARDHPLRLLFGDLSASLARLRVDPLSEGAVAELAQRVGLPGGELFLRTGGNPFFVTEVLAAPADRVPDTVRDAVLARIARLRPEDRVLVEAIAVVPSHAESWLVEAIAPNAADGLENALRAGILTDLGDAVSFRHELARLAVEESTSPQRRRMLHRRVVAALSARPPDQVDAARLAHHADAAGDAESVLTYAVRAALEAGARGAHREAAAHYARAARHRASLSTTAQAELLATYARECHLADREADACEAAEEAARLFGLAGEPLRAAETLLALSTAQRVDGRIGDAERSVAAAMALLEGQPPGRGPAMALAAVAQIAMAHADAAQMYAAGTQAIELAEASDVETLANVLITLGTMEMESAATRAQGRERLDRAIELAMGNGLDGLVGRAWNNLTYELQVEGELADAEAVVAANVRFCQERGVEVWHRCALASRSELELARGEWDKAVETAGLVLGSPGAAVPRIGPLVVLGLVRARRGDPDPWGPLDEALGIARAKGEGELQMVAPVLAARAEAAWLEGRPKLVFAETDPIVERALRAGEEWALPEIAYWRWRAGGRDRFVVPDRSPRGLQIAGQAARAAELWREHGYVYEAALALADTGGEPELRRAHEELRALGARTAAAWVARRARELGYRGLAVGPRASTSGHPARLTLREVEVIGLIAEGLRDAEIAERLFLSPKTVGHHVSAILRKLDVETRSRAVAEATRRGLLARTAD